MSCYRHPREPKVMAYIYRGSRASQRLVFIRFFICRPCPLMQILHSIVTFAEVLEKIVDQHRFAREAIRPPAMAGAD